jgi:hypothetical protein
MSDEVVYTGHQPLATASLMSEFEDTLKMAINEGLLTAGTTTAHREHFTTSDGVKWPVMLEARFHARQNRAGAWRESRGWLPGFALASCTARLAGVARNLDALFFRETQLPGAAAAPSCFCYIHAAMSITNIALRAMSGFTGQSR